MGYSEFGCFWSAGSDAGTHILASTQSNLYQRLLSALIEARKDAGLTQTDVARRIGQRQTFISKFEVGERRLDVAEFLEISRAIGADPHSLIRKAEGDE